MSRLPLAVYRLGRVEYEDGLKLQELFGRSLAQGLGPSVLLLLEHPPVLTLGRGAKRENVIAAPERLAAEGIQVHETNRGGDVTYHGPGQLVGYPIIKLGPGRQDVRRYVRDIEETLIRTVAHFGVTAGRMPKWPGVWVGEEGSPELAKIGAIGVHLSRWQTSHGFALNVNTRLEHFGLIVPCGIHEAGVTSLQQQLGRPIPMAEVESVAMARFAELFDADVQLAEPQKQIVSVTVVQEGRVLCLRRCVAEGGFWQIITGGMEPGERPEETARRELLEETGLSLPVQSLDYQHTFALGRGVPPLICREMAFMAVAPPGVEPKLSAEHDDYQWLPIDAAVGRIPFAGLRRAATMAVARAASS